MMPASGMFLDTNVAGAEHDSCAHNDLPPIFAGLSGSEWRRLFLRRCYSVITSGATSLRQLNAFNVLGYPTHGSNCVMTSSSVSLPWPRFRLPCMCPLICDSTPPRGNQNRGCNDFSDFNVEAGPGVIIAEAIGRQK